MSETRRFDHWGVIGWSNKFVALGDDSDEAPTLNDAYGFERILDPGVIYRVPGDVSGVPRWSEKLGSKGRVFQMGWPSPEPPETKSFLDLQAALAKQRETLTADDPALAKLDAAIFGFLEIAGRLRAAQASLGFLQPNSVRIGTNHDGSTFVTLPDVGFAWDDTGGLYEPDWLAAPQAEFLFDRGSRARNADCLALLQKPLDDRDLRSRAADLAAFELAEVKIAARLIALALVGNDEMVRWCGAAKSLLRLPGKDLAPDTVAPIWDQVLAPAIDGQIPTFDELGLRLQARKPSEHFLYKPPLPPWRGWAKLRRFATVAAATAAVVGLYMLKDVVFPPRSYAPFCSRVAEGSPLFKKLFELKTLHESARVDREDRAAFFELLRECRTDHAAIPICRNNCLDSPTADYLEMMISEGDSVLARLRSIPRPAAVERKEIEGTLAAIHEAAFLAGQPQESQTTMRLTRQFQLRFGSDPSPPLRPPANTVPATRISPTESLPQE